MVTALHTLQAGPGQAGLPVPRSAACRAASSAGSSASRPTGCWSRGSSSAAPCLSALSPPRCKHTDHTMRSEKPNAKKTQIDVVNDHTLVKYQSYVFFYSFRYARRKELYRVCWRKTVLCPSLFIFIPPFQTGSGAGRLTSAGTVAARD